MSLMQKGSSTATSEANRANASKSTGPRTVRGKSVSRYNAKNWGRAERTRELMPALGEKPEEFEAVLAGLRRSLGPRDEFEEMLVSDMADIHARVILTLQDGTRISGYVSQENDTQFMAVGNGQATPVQYQQVADIRAANPDTQVKFAARITTEAAAIAAETPPPVKPHRVRHALSATSKAVLVLAVTAAGVIATLAALGKL